MMAVSSAGKGDSMGMDNRKYVWLKKPCLNLSRGKPISSRNQGQWQPFQDISHNNSNEGNSLTQIPLSSALTKVNHLLGLVDDY
ncbi:hypothetical protein L2E82_48401 [Cichorium intybus]|uniref:Uncharacterized protein n=1 Tax=Cichorium intybus TaxID=13427 RepID=A0ACB8YXY9_CICIN|nr:hypothetical protein L2E82_48401 [Cichorium intybus]